MIREIGIKIATKLTLDAVITGIVLTPAMTIRSESGRWLGVFQDEDEVLVVAVRGFFPTQQVAIGHEHSSAIFQRVNAQPMAVGGVDIEFVAVGAGVNVVPLDSVFNGGACWESGAQGGARGQSKR